MTITCPPRRAGVRGRRWAQRRLNLRPWPGAHSERAQRLADGGRDEQRREPRDAEHVPLAQVAGKAAGPRVRVEENRERPRIDAGVGRAVGEHFAARDVTGLEEHSLADTSQEPLLRDRLDHADDVRRLRGWVRGRRRVRVPDVSL